MKKISKIIFISTIIFSSIGFSDVSVKGYYRKNGTYVQPHVRSSPDSTKANNYGAKTSTSISLYDRDKDNDGIANQNDTDDNNNGVHDDNEY